MAHFLTLTNALDGWPTPVVVRADCVASCVRVAETKTDPSYTGCPGYPERTRLRTTQGETLMVLETPVQIRDMADRSAAVVVPGPQPGEPD